MNTYAIGDAAKKVNRSVKTLQRWDREGILRANRTLTGRRYYTAAQLRLVMGQKPRTNRVTVAYCRVSSQAQKPDLLNQRKALELYCNSRGYTDVEYIDEVGGGMNCRRKGLRNILQRVHDGEVENVIVAHKDRLARFGFEHIVWECSQFGCEVEVLNNETLSPEQEMVQDLMTIIHCFSSRLYGLRNYKKTLKEALK